MGSPWRFTVAHIKMKVKKVFEVMVRSVVTCAGGEGFRDAVVGHFF